ncbi:COG4223 family protein [Beijerinckia indica]|uniref:Uncharacterized protein n=1 Tax=Beijerinckia indica subsp. indica (strain ATCC 9039 / DSM 1715 / NCIMB 8712) TaxID=395963 RepID=B2IJ68_BEII9|nr:hypothetical protein [Beijerinckia indica]ACB94831.1 conserved hypothetical protein [Beijerinckia indica subsp. indica ATCC 9039]
MADENGERAEEQPLASGTGRALQRTPPIIEAKAEENSAEEGLPKEPLFRDDPEVAAKRSPWRNFWPVLMAILVGAVIAVAGEWALQTFYRPESSSLIQADSDFQGLKARLAELESGIRLSQRTQQEGLAAVQEGLGRIDQFDRRLSTTENNLQAQTDTLNQVQETQRGAQPSDRTAEPAEKPDPFAAEREQIDLIDKRVSSIEDDVTRLREEEHKAQQATNAALQAQDPRPYDDRLSLLEQQIASLQQSVAQSKVDIRLLRDAQAENADNRRKKSESLAILGGSLVEKVFRGAPYLDEIEALDGLGADKAKLAALQPNASTGVASLRGLRDQFAALSKSLVVPPPANAEEGFLARIERDAASLVRVKRLDATGTKDLPDQIGAIESALARDELDDALTLWNGLPAEAKAKSAAFAKALQTRLDALRDARAIEANALQALGRQKS